LNTKLLSNSNNKNKSKDESELFLKNTSNNNNDTPPPQGNTNGEATKDQAVKEEKEAKKLKEPARKLRLESEQMDTLQAFETISQLETTTLDNDTEQTEHIQRKIQDLKERLQKSSSLSNNSTTTNEYENNKNTALSQYSKKKILAHQSYPREIQELFAKAVNVTDITDAKTIVERVQERNTIKNDLLIKAKTYAGFYTLPIPIKTSIAKNVGFNDTENITNIMNMLEEMSTTDIIIKETGVEFTFVDNDDNYEPLPFVPFFLDDIQQIAEKMKSKFILRFIPIKKIVKVLGTLSNSG